MVLIRETPARLKEINGYGSVYLALTAICPFCGQNTIVEVDRPPRKCDHYRGLRGKMAVWRYGEDTATEKE